MTDSGDHSDAPLPGSEAMLAQLQGLLQQLEAAAGGPDAEARHALDRLHQSLTALDAARAGNLDEVPDASDDARPLPQRMETLQGRVAELEARMEGLSEGTQEILSGSAAEWVQGQMQVAGDQGSGGEEAAGGGAGSGGGGGLNGQSK